MNRQAFRFFLSQCGGSRRVELAGMLARAEAMAADRDLDFIWEHDEEPCIGCDCGSDCCPCSAGTAHEILCCTVVERGGDDVLASLCNICEPSDAYRRVVEAELALEALEQGRC